MPTDPSVRSGLLLGPTTTNVVTPPAGNPTFSRQIVLPNNLVSSSSPQSYNPNSAVSVGETVAVCVVFNGTSTQGTITVTDTKGNTYSLAQGLACFVQGGIYTSTLTTALTTGDSLRVNMTTPNATAFAMAAYVFDNVAGVDTTTLACNSANPNTVTSTVTTTAAKTAIFGFVANISTSTAPTYTGGSFTSLGHADNNGGSISINLFVVRQDETSAGTYGPGGSLPIFTDWECPLVAFK